MANAGSISHTGAVNHPSSEDSLLTVSAPKLLYHYTSAAGLLGIVSSSSLWATAIQYLNDGEEVAYAANIVADYARTRSEELEAAFQRGHNDSWQGGRAERLWGIAEGIDGHAQFRYSQPYVTCFCSQGNLLSQWRAYATNGGYALGFEFDALTDYAAAGGGRLDEVLYGVQALAELKEELSGLGPGAGFPGANGWAYANEVVWPLLVRVKNPAFHEENEWRVILDAQKRSQAQRRILFRTGVTLGVIPYVELPIEMRCLRSVIVGPGPYPEIRRAGVSELLRSRGHSVKDGEADEGVEVSISTIAGSYRP